MYDVAIIGAGPAGATLARMLAPRFKVLLVDKRTLNVSESELPFRKCCGGLLAPDGQAMLSRMGLGLPRHVLVGPQLFVVRTIDLASGLERFYQRYYINFDREKFDRWIASLVPGSVDRRFGCLFMGCEEDDEGVTLRLTARGETRSERARLLVGADGAASRVRRLALAGCRAPRAYMAVQQWFEAERPQPYFSVFFDPGLTDFYCWTIPKESSLIVGGAFYPRQRAAQRFESLKEKLSRFGYRLGNSERKEGALLLRPAGPRDITHGRGRVALVGEAAGWISPSSAEGLSYAMRSGLALADALGRGTEGCLGRYRKNTADLSRNIFLKTLKAQVIFRPLMRRLVMRTGLQSEEIL
jgi:flavin-dependent dehydrogenase